MPRGHYPHTSATLEERFWRYVEVLDDGCWRWVGPITRAGYGQIELPGRRGTDQPRRVLQATHVAHWLALGTWPGSQVNHTCDRPWCVQFGHLYDGTQRENVDDMIRRGRYKNVR